MFLASLVLPEDTAVTLSETRATSNMSTRYVKVKYLLVSMNKAKIHAFVLIKRLTAGERRFHKEQFVVGGLYCCEKCAADGEQLVRILRKKKEVAVHCGSHL